MDLTYGAQYEAFREEVAAFLETHKDVAPKNPTLRSKEAIDWQKTLIKAGYFARTIPAEYGGFGAKPDICLLYTSPSPRDGLLSRMPSSA